MIRPVIFTHRITLVYCLIGLALWLVVACAAPTSAPITPAPGARLYTRTPTPTAVPATPTPTLSPQTLYQQGLTQRDAWDLQTALAHLDAALAPHRLGASPDRSHAPIYTRRAELYRLAGRYEEAAADIQTALTLDPNLAEAWRQKALLNQAEEAWDEALAAVDKLIELQPDDGTAYVLRAQIYAEGLGKIRLALANYDRAIARDPSFDRATLVERWHILAALERWDDALWVSREMFATGSDDPLRYYFRGWSLMKLGQLDDAIQMLFFGLKRHPDYPVVFYYALGVTYYERRAWAEAVQALEVALSQSGGSSQINPAQQQLDITTADILGPMGVAYLELGQCETGAAVVKRASAESADPQTWEWAIERVEACYVALTPTPTPTPAEP